MQISIKGANRLINEKSPYLLQHANNPVDWYPWSDEAFQKAKEEDKPIFLSIGYSTCHWCHVMENESFEDQEVADIINRYFIPIKVDKEERPDIDSVYMTTCQALTGQGGWPLTIIMTPEQRPFFAGTYFPKKARYQMPGLVDILQTIAKKWEQDKAELVFAGDEITDVLKEQFKGLGTQGELSEDILDNAFFIFQKSFDEKNGGFSHSPKFPTPHNLMFLLRYYLENNDDFALKMAEKSLEQMYRGGLFDHIGFGFSRYSTDQKWLVPHFEKMLYDNALLIIAYLEAYQITKKELYKNIAKKTLAYILREMTDREGGFYCAQDADSEGEEGKFYAFTPQEIINVLGDKEGSYFNQHFGITNQGNFEGKSIPNLLENDTFDKLDEQMEQQCSKLLEYRTHRAILHKDDKILTAWNGLMIVALAKASRILGEGEYLKAAQKAAAFIENKLVKDGHLCVRYREGESAGIGTIDDYAFYIWSLIELYEATYEIKYLKRALDWNNRMQQSFWDEKNGGYYMTAGKGEKLIIRPKELYDGAMPSGNSVAAYNLIKLARMTADAQLEEQAKRQLRFMAGEIKNYPAGYSFYLIAMQYALSQSREVICVIRTHEELIEIKKLLNQIFMPNTVILIKNMQQQDEINMLIPFLKDYQPTGVKSAFYLCENKTCRPPFYEMEQLFDLLKN